MSQLDEWIDNLEDLTDRLFISGLENVPENTMTRLSAAMQQFHEAGLSYGSKLISDMILQIEQSRRDFHEPDDASNAFAYVRLQSFIDAARSIRQLNKLRDYYGVE